MSNIYYLRTTDVLKTSIFSERKLEEMLWRAKRYKIYYIRGNVYFGIIIFGCLSSTKPCLRFLLIYFAREIKGFCQSSLGNEVDFRDIMNFPPNILAKNQNFKKQRHSFVDESAMITTTLMSSCHWKTLVTFSLRKKRPENGFLTLTVNYRKIVQKTNYTIQNSSKLAI